MVIYSLDFDFCTFRSEEFCLNEHLVFGILFGAWLVSAYSKIVTKDVGKGQLQANFTSTEKSG